MDHFDFDEIEKNYKKSVLKTRKTSAVRRKKSKFNHFSALAISLILAIIVVLIILNVITLNMKSEKTSTINNELIDEVVYRDTMEFLVETEENQNMVNTEEKDGDILGVEQKVRKVVEDNSTEVLSKYYVIQVVASKSMDAVKKYIGDIEKKGHEAYFIKEGTSVYHYKVMIKKKFKTRNEADTFAAELITKKVIDNYWIKLINESQN